MINKIKKNHRQIKIGLIAMGLIIVLISWPTSLKASFGKNMYSKEWKESKYFNNKLFITLSPSIIKSYFPSEFNTKVFYKMDSSAEKAIVDLVEEQLISSFSKGIAVGMSFLKDTFFIWNVRFEYSHCNYPDSNVVENRKDWYKKEAPEPDVIIESVNSYSNSKATLNTYGIFLEGGLILPYIYTTFPISLNVNLGFILYDRKFHSNYTESLESLPEVEYFPIRNYDNKGGEWWSVPSFLVSTGIGIRYYFLKNFAISFDSCVYWYTYSTTRREGNVKWVGYGHKDKFLDKKFSGGLSFYF